MKKVLYVVTTSGTNHCFLKISYFHVFHISFCLKNSCRSTASTFFHFLFIFKCLHFAFIFERYFLWQNFQLIVICFHFLFQYIQDAALLPLCSHCFLIFVHLQDVFFPPLLVVFKFFSLSLALSKLPMMCLEVFFMFLVLEFY